MNKLLGELEIELGGQKYIMKPTHAGIVQIETLSGKSIAKLFKSFTSMDVSYTDVTATIYGGLYGKNGNKELLSVAEIGEKVFNEGLVRLASVGFFIASIYSGTPIDEFVAQREKDKEPKDQNQVQEEKKT